MKFLPQFVFIILSIGTAWMVYRRFTVIRKMILSGKKESLTDQPDVRWKQMLRIALGQKKMWDRPVAGFLHLLVYVGFVLINIELLEIVLDGLLGTHRLLANALGSFYTFLINFIELLALGVIVACSIFLLRRTIFPVARLQATRHRELVGWPKLDAIIILLTEITLMWFLLSMNAADQILQQRIPEHYPATGLLAISGILVPLFENSSTEFLSIYERSAWWLHLVGIFAFAIYITYSKHLHILFAFPNTYYARLTPPGQFQNMPEITQEVQLMLGLASEADTPAQAVPEVFGAKDVHDLSWKSLLDAYTCTECGRCSSVCPATLTGKALSPRKIMTDTRDRLEEIGKQWQQTQILPIQDQKSLLYDYITEEEILACTSCNACVEACPVLINPLSIITELRRYQIMNLAKAPNSWNMMFSNIETNQAPWKFAPSDRFKWASNQS